MLCQVFISVQFFFIIWKRIMKISFHENKYFMLFYILHVNC